ncbi:MAG: hypothetical protein PHR77_04830 [Kiritimatiellae bacterium]|nr:hypothetical protein [Kiritimatiellia bacterium]MDD5519860.1 hypothetical protein [Kiritimatiellia bacterium]
MADSNLLFRRQFLLTPDACSSLSHWQHIHVGIFHIYAHPDVQLSTVTSADTNVTLSLVGYIIDPNFPERSNTDVLNTIASLGDSVENISDYLCALSGRFVLILTTAKETLLFHDPCGLRTVYYTKYEGKVFVGSQPYIFKQVMPLKDGELFSSFFRSSYAKRNIEYWIPSGCSLFEEVHHLIPNHYLRLSTLEQIRYWPKRILLQKRVDEVITDASDLLKKLMIAANNRFKLALPVTAGWDSRILLSASKSISREIYFYTLQYRNLNSRSSDIKIPAELLRSLGLRHNLIDCRKTISDEFIEIYRRNSPLAHIEDWGKIAYGMIDKYPQDRVAIKGNCSEIARSFYYKYGFHRPIISPDQIVALVNGWQTIPFVRDQIFTWYNQAIEVAAETNMDILDLFYWEHRMGSWQAQSQLEWDIVQEAYTPFNHRGLLELMLGVSTNLRSAPNYSLYKMMFKLLWPEVMKQPINPTTTMNRLRKILKHGIYEIARRVYAYAVRKNGNNGKWQ